MSYTHKIKYALTIVALVLVSFVYAGNSSSSVTAKIYPNPVTEEFFTVDADKIINSVEVLNVLGQQVQKTDNLSDKKVKVELNSTQNGIYLVKIIYEDKTEYVQRIFIK